jgi:precorrin-2 dehydrogenase/sirohydrochlorin ferrochelatase
MSYYPILVELEGQKALVVGGGNIAQRKIDTLLQHGAEVRVVSKELNDHLEQYLAEGKIKLIGREFDESQIKDSFMVIAATDDTELNKKISAAAKKNGILINAVDQPALCTFIVPSIMNRGDLLIAVSTSGKSPALAKKIREGLENSFGKSYETFLVLMGRLRKEVLEMGLSQQENRRIFNELVDSPALNALEANDMQSLALILNRILNQNLSVNDVENYLKAG